MRIIQAKLNQSFSERKIAVVVSRFNHFITERLREACVSKLLAHGVQAQHVTVVEVPGAFELPLMAKHLLKQGKYDAAILLGAVIRGETQHYDYVCQQVSAGCQQVSLELQKPVIFGVLTTNNEEEALDRVGGRHGHKGYDAAEAALVMIDIMNQV